MKVTSYYPVFFAEDLETEAKRYIDDLGFSLIHDAEVKGFRYLILDNHGNRIDLIYTSLPFASFTTGFYGMRANVDNFDEGLKYFTGQGLKQEGEIREEKSSKSVVLVGRDGMRVVLFQHLKGEEILF